MKIQNGQRWFTATDLAHHLSCKHLTELERQVAMGLLHKEHYHDSVIELLRELGDRHELAYLDFLQMEGRSVVAINQFGGQERVERTLEAMRQGADVITQAALERSPWRGRADFLLKVDRESNLGPWSYEVADTKLAQTTRAGTVLQLCLYTEIVADLQGVEPKSMYVVRPGEPFETDVLRVADYAAYYRMVKRRFEQDFREGPNPNSYPEPNPHCQVCDWWRHCNKIWRNDDHLKLRS
jgi:uncharacterized protein